MEVESPELDKIKLEQLKKVLPEHLTRDELYESLLLNSTQDFDSIISDLPLGFYAEEDRDLIHVGNTNQIGIYYGGEIRKGNGAGNSKIASLSLHYRVSGDVQTMCIENMQGELKERHYSNREVRRVFGKLNSHFGEDWRVGLSKQLVLDARDQDMEVKGRVPGLFYMFGSSNLPTYPLYSLNYVQTYLNAGIPLEDIEFKTVPEDAKTNWDIAIDLLKTKSSDEQLSLLALASSDYSKSYRELRYQWLGEETIDMDTYETKTQIEFDRVFATYLS